MGGEEGGGTQGQLQGGGGGVTCRRGGCKEGSLWFLGARGSVSLKSDFNRLPFPNSASLVAPPPGPPSLGGGAAGYPYPSRPPRTARCPDV